MKLCELSQSSEEVIDAIDESAFRIQAIIDKLGLTESTAKMDVAELSTLLAGPHGQLLDIKNLEKGKKYYIITISAIPMEPSIRVERDLATFVGISNGKLAFLVPNGYTKLYPDDFMFANKMKDFGDFKSWYYLFDNKEAYGELLSFLSLRYSEIINIKKLNERFERIEYENK